MLVTIPGQEPLREAHYAMFPSITLPAQPLEALLHRTLSRACDEPHNNSYQLLCSHRLCGYIFPPAVQVLRQSPHAIIDDAQQTVTLNPAHGSLNDAIAEIAQMLNQAGCVTRWRDELLDLWSTDYTSLGAIERGVVRPLGALTRAVHLHAWSSTGGIWVARRSLTKPTDPGLWDTLVGGLIGWQEDPALALERESFEEAGLPAPIVQTRTPIRTIALLQRQLPEGLQRELVLTAECVLDGSIRPENQDGESMTIECLPPEEVVSMIERDLFTVEAALTILEDLIFRTSGQRIHIPPPPTSQAMR